MRVQLSILYEQDYCEWILTTVNLLRQGRFSEVDLDNLVEELETMGRSEKSALESNLRVVLMHLLKYKYQPEKRTNSWRYTIREHRLRIDEAFKNSPSLKRYFTEVFAENYQQARKLAADETGLPVNTFPSECVFTLDETLNPEYLPE